MKTPIAVMSMLFATVAVAQEPAVDTGFVHVPQQLVFRVVRNLAMNGNGRTAFPDVDLRVADPHPRRRANRLSP